MYRVLLCIILLYWLRLVCVHAGFRNDTGRRDIGVTACAHGIGVPDSNRHSSDGKEKLLVMDLIIGVNPGIIKMTGRIFDPDDALYIEGIDGVMFSYALVAGPNKEESTYRRLWKRGYRLGYSIPDDVKIYLDNGSFSFSQQGYTVHAAAYRTFVDRTTPDWYPMPQDYIPSLDMPLDEQHRRMEKTMRNNEEWSGGDYAMVLHVGPYFDSYVERFRASESLMSSRYVALGALASRRLRVSRLAKASDLSGDRETFEYIKETREAFRDSHLHLFGIGGARSTIHLSALLGADSIDSIGWFTAGGKFGRALSPHPTKSDVYICSTNSDARPTPSKEDIEDLEACQCPTCQEYGIEGLKDPSVEFGVQCRSCHNLWHLVQEKKLVEKHLADGTYKEWHREHYNRSSFHEVTSAIFNPSTEKQLSLF